MHMKSSAFLAGAASALALASGCTSFHGYETSLPSDVKPGPDFGGPYRIVEVSAKFVSAEGGALPGRPTPAVDGTILTRHLADKHPGAFSTEKAATPLVVRQTICGDVDFSDSTWTAFANMLSFGFVPQKMATPRALTTSFLLPADETTEPYKWNLRVNIHHNVNLLKAASYSQADGWYPGMPLEASLLQGVTGTKDPVIAEDYKADKAFSDKVIARTATKEDHAASSDRIFWQQLSPDVGSGRWHEYAGEAIVEALNRLSPDERAALKNNLAARLADCDPTLLDGCFADYPVRETIAPLGREALIGTWTGSRSTELLQRRAMGGIDVGIVQPPRQSFQTKCSYTFNADGTFACTTTREDTGAEHASEGRWSYANGKLTTVQDVIGNEVTTEREVRWYGPAEFELVETPGTKSFLGGETTVTVAANGVSTASYGFSGSKSVTKTTPILLKRK